jgi:hypothetical protein
MRLVDVVFFFLPLIVLLATPGIVAPLAKGRSCPRVAKAQPWDEIGQHLRCKPEGNPT